MSTTHAHADRNLLPRGLIARRSYRFSVGQYVTFHECTGMVEHRSFSAMGVELYQIFIQGDDRPQRTVRGDYLELSPAPLAAAMDWPMAA